MIVSETLLNKTRSAFDLNEYEVKTWIALLSRNESTAGELSEISNVPRSRVYDILESLTAKGYVTKKQSIPVKYLAVSPETALAAAKRNALEKAKAEASKIDKLKSASLFKEMNEIYKKGSTAINTDVSGLIKGKTNLYAHMHSLISSAKSSLTIMTTKKGLLRKADKFSAELKEAKKRGVSIRIASPVKSISEIPLELHKIADLKSSDMDARFIIADGKSALLMLHHDEEVHNAYDLGVLITSPFASNAFEYLVNNALKNMDKTRK